jgi:hypothetical protein
VNDIPDDPLPTVISPVAPNVVKDRAPPFPELAALAENNSVPDVTVAVCAVIVTVPPLKIDAPPAVPPALELTVAPLPANVSAPGVEPPAFIVIAPPLPDVACALSATEAIDMPPLDPAAPVLIILIVPPAPDVAPLLALMALATVNNPVLLSVRVIVPPVPAPDPLAFITPLVNVPPVAVLLAVRLTIPPLPALPKAFTFTTAAAGKVKVRPAVIVTVPPVPAVEAATPPFAWNCKPVAVEANTSPVAPRAENVTLPPLPAPAAFALNIWLAPLMVIL